MFWSTNYNVVRIPFVQGSVYACFILHFYMYIQFFNKNVSISVFKNFTKFLSINFKIVKIYLNDLDGPIMLIPEFKWTKILQLYLNLKNDKI